MNILAGQERCPFCRKTEFAKHLHAHCLRKHPLSYEAACRYFDKMLVLLKEQEATTVVTTIEDVAEIESLNGDWHVDEWTASGDQLRLEMIDSDEDPDLDKYDSPQSPDPEPPSAASAGSQSETDASEHSYGDNRQQHVVKIGLRQHVKCQLCSETFTMASHAVTHHLRDHLRERGIGISRRRLQAAYARDNRVQVALLRCTLCKTTFLERPDRRHECPTRPTKKSAQSVSADRRNSSTRSSASHSTDSRSSSSSSSCSCSSCSSTSSSSKNGGRGSRHGAATVKSYDSRAGNRARWCIHGPLKFCKFWRLGNCRNGAKCGYAHSLCPKDGRCEDEHYGQFTKDRTKEQTDGELSDLFAGVAIFVNGYTEPSASELRRLMMKHGGAYHMYELPNTTHVVVSNLPKSKIDKLKPGEKLVTAAWITDSIAAGRLLPDVDYLLYGEKQGCAALNKFVRPADQTPSRSPAMLPPPAVDEQSNSRSLPKTSDPQFLKEYYARSRLHFISTWGQKMKRLVDELRAASDGTFPGRQLLAERIDVGDGSAVLEPVFVHIDMDCFFVSVGLASRPHLRGKPVVVTSAKGVGAETMPGQQDKTSSWAEISSCNYEARAAGLKNGMLLGKALKACPDLTAIPYEFEAYQEASIKLYHILASYTLNIRAVSCDEMYIDLTELCRDSSISDPLKVVAVIRQQIADETGCSASAGLGPNMLVARLATRRAKPNGQFYVPQKDVHSFMAEQRIADLPGIGRNIREKLESHFGSLEKCADLEAIPVGRLKATFGPKHGQQLNDLCRGIDNSTIKDTTERKSVSCDINYGIRLQSDAEAVEFLKNLAVEVTKKLDEINMAGRMMTMKLMTRQADAPEKAQKYMGHGLCDTVSRSTTLSRPIRDDRQIASTAISLFRQLSPVVVDVRGVAIMMTKLESTSKPSPGDRRQISHFCVKPTGAAPPVALVAPIVQRAQRPAARHEEVAVRSAASPFDPEVLAALPDDIKREIAGHPSQFQMPRVERPHVHRAESRALADLSLLLPDGSKCDKNVLAELPEELRSEVRRACRVRPRTETTPKLNELLTAFPIAGLPSRPLVTTPQLRGECDYEAVKKLLLEILAHEQPSDQVVADLIEYFRQLIVFGNLKSAGCFLRIMDRILAERESDVWKTAQQLIIEAIQNAAVQHYGCRFEWRS
uniref:DNA repair protein REV1 n=1 Tax=Plectus sambesii TaxID=2011161 RepID=A0A914W2G8_9BILA